MSTLKRMLMGTTAVAMVGGMLLTGCSSSKNEPTKSAEPTKKLDELKPVKLVWYIRSPEPKNVQAVMQKANEIIQSKINATLEFKFINPGDYDTKMQLVMSSGEEYDIAFTSNWANIYGNNVSKGAYVAVDDLLKKYPDLQNMFKKEVWDGVKINGKTYGVPNNQIMTGQDGLWLKKDIVDKYKVDTSKLKSLNDLTALFQTVKDGEKDVIPIRFGINLTTAFTEFAPAVEGFNIDLKTWKVYFQPETLTAQYKVMRDWYQKGFFPQDVATLKDELPLLKSGKVFSRYTRQLPGVNTFLKAQYGFDTLTIATGPSFITRGAATSTLNGISVTSKNPDRAMMLINLIDTNKDLFNLLKYGIEGQDYTKVSANRIETKPDAYSLQGWLFGNEFNSFVYGAQPDDLWEQTKKVNDTAVVDPTISFSFDRTSVENEIAQLSAIMPEYTQILSNGLDDVDKTMKAMMDKRKAAGHDKVMAEIQKQLDEWRKTQK